MYKQDACTTLQYMNKWEIITSEMMLHNPWCRVRKDQVKLPNGAIIDDFFVNERPDIALILPMTSQSEIVFVRQYRHGVKEILLELPAGAFNPDQEEGINAAKRELLEETGYITNNIIPLGIFYDNPVKDTNKIHLFLGKNVYKYTEQKLDITEEIEIVLIPVKEVINRILNGEICVTGSIAAIFLGLEKIKE